MIQYFDVNGKQYPFLLANRQLRRILSERKLRLSQIDEILMDMEAMHQIFTIGVQSGLTKVKSTERVTSAMIDEWNEDGYLPFVQMVKIVNEALKPNMETTESDAREADYQEEGN